MRTTLLSLCMLVLPCIGAPGAAHAQNAALASELVKVFDAHNAAVKAKDVDKALALRSAPFKKAKRFDKKEPMTSQMYLAYVARVTPQSYQVEYAALESDKNKATLGLVANLADDDGKVKPRIVNFEFLKEGAAWKLGEHIFWLVDVDKLQHPKSITFQPKSAYTRSWATSGRIIKTTYNADHTLVILREGDKDRAVFLPAKASLSELKLTPADLDPGNKAQFRGAVQTQDELKMWATSGGKE